MTEQQTLILNHAVVDANAWFAHCVSVFGNEAAEQMLEQKVERHRVSYEAAVALPDYKNRAARVAEQNLL